MHACSLSRKPNLSMAASNACPIDDLIRMNMCYIQHRCAESAIYGEFVNKLPKQLVKVLSLEKLTCQQIKKQFTCRVKLSMQSSFLWIDFHSAALSHHMLLTVLLCKIAYKYKPHRVQKLLPQETHVSIRCSPRHLWIQNYYKNEFKFGSTTDYLFVRMPKWSYPPDGLAAT